MLKKQQKQVRAPRNGQHQQRRRYSELLPSSVVVLLLLIVSHFDAGTSAPASLSCLDTEFMTDVRTLPVARSTPALSPAPPPAFQWCNSDAARRADADACARHYASTFRSSAREQRQPCVARDNRCLMSDLKLQCPIRPKVSSSAPRREQVSR
eukprot:1533366-Pleurochrysis_carterae.AAC.7